jgi:hypothetical protein
MTEEVKGPRKFILGFLELFVLLAVLGSIGAYCANEYSYYHLTKIPEIGDTSLNQRGLDHLLRFSTLQDADTIVQVYHAKVNSVRITLGPAKDSFDLKEGKISFIEICDQKFSTPEGIHPGVSFRSAKEKSIKGPCIIPAWGTYVTLPSGWEAVSYKNSDENSLPESSAKIDCLIKNSRTNWCICMPCQKKNPNIRWPSDKPSDKSNG